MRLTAKSEYGLLALIDLACRYGSGPASAREVAERQGIPTKFLEQLFVGLRKADLVAASRGAHGGFSLTRPPAEIRVLDVVEALEGPLRPTACQASTGCAKSSACAASHVWERATTALREVFAETTLADLASEQTAYNVPLGE